MAYGITLRSGSIGATKEDLERVFARHGLEVDEAEETEAGEPGDSEPEKKVPEEPAKPSNNQVMLQHFINYRDAVQQFKKQYPDWDEVVNRPILLPREVIDAVVVEELPALTYHMGRHPEFTKRIVKMRASDAVAEIRKLAEQLRPPEGVVYHGTTALRSGNIKYPVRNSPPAPRSAAAAAAKGNYKAFKATQRRGRGLGRLA
jgi:hypothetical protein